jgi:hypothetical protein
VICASLGFSRQPEVVQMDFVYVAGVLVFLAATWGLVSLYERVS